jgi:hypothetical protein
MRSGGIRLQRLTVVSTLTEPPIFTQVPVLSTMTKRGP